jgi:uncharacterized protein
LKINQKRGINRTNTNKMKTLVVGASTSPERYSYKAARMLLNHGHEIELLGTKKGEIEGHQIENKHLQYTDIDTVTLYIGAKHQPEMYQYLIDLKPRRIIFNPGTENLEFEQLAKTSGIETEEACTLVLLSTGQY